MYNNLKVHQQVTHSRRTFDPPSDSLVLARAMLQQKAEIGAESGCIVFIAFFALAMITIIGSGCQSGQPTRPVVLAASADVAAPSQAAAVAGSSATMWVTGLSCPLCAHNIDRQLHHISSVDRVQVDLGSGKVVVVFTEGVRPSNELLAKAVHDSGFTLDRFEPEPEVVGHASAHP